MKLGSASLTGMHGALVSTARDEDEKNSKTNFLKLAMWSLRPA